ncbi:MAG TPA: adenylate kinase [Arthrobacter sp.]|nr:adenylate kinase [Arthrobacter sp.]
MLTAERILIYGVTGSGKSTLCRDLGEKTGLPWHWVDDLTWEPGWVQVPLDVQRSRIASICAGRRWVLDSAYSSWVDIPLESVQLIICLDYPRWLSFGRLLVRTFVRNRDKKEICNGNIESFRNTFSRDSILLWHFKSFGRKRARMRAMAADAGLPSAGSPAVLLFKSPRETAAWLRSLPDNDEKLNR